MKQILCLYILLLTALYTSAQDMITLKNGITLNGQVIAIDASTIAYSNNTSTNLQTVPRDSVSTINYANGSVYAIPSLANTYTAPPNSIRYKEQQLAYSKQVNKQQRMQVAGISCLGVAGGLAVVTGTFVPVGLAIEKRHPNAGLGLYATGIMCIVGIVPLTITGAILTVRAKKLKHRLEQPKMTLGFAPFSAPILPAGNVYGTQTGMAMRFTF
jgi:hypothetical protein